jgi:hypothetical protein
MDYIRVHGIGQKGTNRQRANDAAFFSVQLFAIIAMAFASDLLSPGTPRANEMEATDPLV